MTQQEVVEVIYARGHENIQAVHPTTLMITKDPHVSVTGDCIVAVAADKAAADLKPEFKEALKKPNAQLTLVLEVDGVKEAIIASGSPNLMLTHSSDLVLRKSSFVCARTLAVQADKASIDLPRQLVEKLKSKEQTVKISLIVKPAV